MLRGGDPVDFTLLLPWSSVLELVSWETEWGTFSELRLKIRLRDLGTSFIPFNNLYYLIKYECVLFCLVFIFHCEIFFFRYNIIFLLFYITMLISNVFISNVCYDRKPPLKLFLLLTSAYYYKYGKMISLFCVPKTILINASLRLIMQSYLKSIRD